MFLNSLYFFKIYFSRIAFSDTGLIQRLRIWSGFRRWILWMAFIEVAQTSTSIEFNMGFRCWYCSLQLHRRNFSSFRYQSIVGLCFLNHGIPRTILWFEIFIMSNWIFSQCCWIRIGVGRVSFRMYPPSWEMGVPSMTLSSIGLTFRCSGIINFSTTLGEMKFPVAPESIMAVVN